MNFGWALVFATLFVGGQQVHGAGPTHRLICLYNSTSTIKEGKQRRNAEKGTHSKWSKSMIDMIYIGRCSHRGNRNTLHNSNQLPSVDEDLAFASKNRDAFRPTMR